MAYLGNTPQQKFSQRYYYTASNNQTTFSGTDNNGATLKYEDNRYVDVFLNGVKLIDTTDYTATSKTSVVLSSGAAANDNLEIYVQGIYTTADMVSSARGGVFYENVTFANNVTVSSSLSVGGNYVSPVQSFRNKIINGNFDIWQRGTSISTYGYLADRWFMNISGSTFTSSRQSFTLGQTDVPGEPTYYHRTVVSSVAGAGNSITMQHRMESVMTLASQTATLSFWAKADSSKNIAVEFYQYFGSGGSPSSAVSSNITTFALTSSWQKFTVTVSVPSISGKTLGSDNNNFFGIIFWFDAGSTYNSRTNSLGQQSGTFDIAQVQLEAGSVATPFEQRPIGTELALCQRYYEIGESINSSLFWSGYTAGASTYYQPIKFSVRKRGVPTVAISSASVSGFSSITVGSSEVDGFRVDSTATGVQSSAYFRGTWTASAEL